MNAKWPRILLLSCAIGGISIASVRAQDQTVSGKLTVTQGLKSGTSSSTDNLEFRTDGTIISKGVYSSGTSSLLSGDQGAGTRLLWYPTKAAFRAGVVNSSQWDDACIGPYSMSFGLNNLASGEGSVSLGENNSASFYYDTAIGSNNTAGWVGSVALGTGNNAQYEAVAIGTNCFALTNWDLVLGVSNTATGLNDIDIGTDGISTGLDSVCLGYCNTASGDHSYAMGYFITTPSYGSYALGQFNNPIYSSGGATAWIATDPLFELGNGSDASHPSDALVVYKNGNAALQGTLQIAPGGDIPMYAGE